MQSVLVITNVHNHSVNNLQTGTITQHGIGLLYSLTAPSTQSSHTAPSKEYFTTKNHI